MLPIQPTPSSFHSPPTQLPASGDRRHPTDGSPVHMMDPPAPSPRSAAGEGAGPAEQSGRRPRSAVRCVLGVAFPIAASFLFSFLVGLAGLALGSLSSNSSASMPSTCRILSTGQSPFPSRFITRAAALSRLISVLFRVSKYVASNVCFTVSL
jgi:hypothetical protein